MSAVLDYLPTNDELIGWRERPKYIDAMEPMTTAHVHWPPNYLAVYQWRLKQIALINSSPEMLRSAKAYYAQWEHAHEFVMHWMDTYNPRSDGAKWVPFVFFTKQEEFFEFLIQCIQDQQNGLVEKCRDAGLTWLSCAFSVWAWLFVPDIAIGWGSRKEDLVDRIGDPDSIFEKMRLILKRLPECFLPDGYNRKFHETFCKFINPENGSIIAGEAGDNIGRGGRKSIYFKDESAHYERPEKVEAALGDNTNVQIDISSVNGLGNVYHRKREAGIDWARGNPRIEPGYTRVFVVDWRDHPTKTQAWYDLRKAKHVREGLQHIFAQEVDRDYSAAVSNTIIPYEWLSACVDAHERLEWMRAEAFSNNWSAGLDIADGGIDRNGLIKRQSIIVRHAAEWGDRDPGVTTRNAVADLRIHRGIKVQYDCIGVGASVKSEYNRLVEVKQVEPNEILLVPWNAGAGVLDPAFYIIPDDDKSTKNRDFFLNLKAQAWWSMRTRVYKTFRAITEGVFYPVEELCSFDSKCPLVLQLLKELAQPTKKADTATMKMVIDKKPDGMKSPNLADACVMSYFPVPEHHAFVAMGTYGT